MDKNINVSVPESFMDSARDTASTVEGSFKRSLSELSSSPQSIETTAPSGRNWSKIAMYVGIILILAVLGFNLFSHLGNLAQKISDVIKPISSIIGGGAVGGIKKTIDISATGSKGIIDGSTRVVDSGLDVISGTLSTNKKPTINKIATKLPINKPKKKKKENTPPPSPKNKKGPSPDESGSTTQSKPSKPSYCYIGEDRGTRSCIKVDEDSKCMSGEIFPSMDLCINPDLRN